MKFCSNVKIISTNWCVVNMDITLLKSSWWSITINKCIKFWNIFAAILSFSQKINTHQVLWEKPLTCMKIMSQYQLLIPYFNMVYLNWWKIQAESSFCIDLCNKHIKRVRKRSLSKRWCFKQRMCFHFKRDKNGCISLGYKNEQTFDTLILISV